MKPNPSGAGSSTSVNFFNPKAQNSLLDADEIIQNSNNYISAKNLQMQSTQNTKEEDSLVEFNPAQKVRLSLGNNQDSRPSIQIKKSVIPA